ICLLGILLTQDETKNFIRLCISYFKVASELKEKFYACMERITENPDLITKMDVQLEDFNNRKEFFGSK
ncbi:hypothetical protein S83_001057, partial [Arachis hypogaea]